MIAIRSLSAPGGLASRVESQLILDRSTVCFQGRGHEFLRHVPSTGTLWKSILLALMCHHCELRTGQRPRRFVIVKLAEPEPLLLLSRSPVPPGSTGVCNPG